MRDKQDNDSVFAGDPLDSIKTLFNRLALLPPQLRTEVLTMRSHPAHLSLACQFLLRIDSSNIENAIPMIENGVLLDSVTADLQFAESYLLEANELREAGDYISAYALYEIGRQLCRNVTESTLSDDSPLKQAAQQWMAECLGNMGSTFLSTDEPAHAVDCLKSAHRIFADQSNLQATAYCEQLLSRAMTAVSESDDDKSESADANDHIIFKAGNALVSGKVMQFMWLAPECVNALEELPPGSRVQFARELLAPVNPRLSTASEHLLARIAQQPELDVYRDSRFVWSYFTSVCCYGLVSNPCALFALVHLVESLATSVPGITERNAFREAFLSHYEEAFRWALSKQKFMLALRLADQMKARATLDIALLGKTDRGSENNPIADAARMLWDGGSACSIKQIGKIRQDIPETSWWFSVGEFEGRVRASSGQPSAKKNEELPTFFSVNASRRLVNTESLILEYAICEDYLHVFAVPSTRYQDRQDPVEHWIRQIGLSPESHLDTTVTELMDCYGVQSMLEPEAPNALSKWEAAGRKLYDLVIGRVEDRWLSSDASTTLEERVKHHHHLVIVPTGPLCAIPWLVLRSSKGWLWQKHLVSILPSLSFQWSAAYVPRPITATISSVLLVANPTGDLPHSEAECRHVEQVLRDADVRCKVLTHEAATIQAVLDLIPEYDMLHFACHGVNIPGNPADSHLVLADGNLRASDIVGLDLSGKSVVLSACKSAMGESEWSDNAFSLAHACLIGGARYAVGSLWEVPDASTCLLMQVFYHWLLAGGSPQIALNLAIQATRHEYPSPYDWGAFAIYGSPEDTDARGIIRQTVTSLRKHPVDILLLGDHLLAEKRLLANGL